MTDLSTDLTGKVVLIAGASSGMGKAAATAVAGAGARTILAARNRDALTDLQSQIAQDGGQAIVIPTDLTDPHEVAELIQQALVYGGRLDAAIITVGANIKQRTLDELTSDSWSGMLATNLTAPFHVTQAVVPVFRSQQNGLIIYVASSAAKKPDKSGVAYQATKAGVVGLANGTMEEERENGIRTTVIFPGLTNTPLVLQRPTPTPQAVLDKALQPEDVAKACMFVLGLPARAHVPELVLYPSQG